MPGLNRRTFLLSSVAAATPLSPAFALDQPHSGSCLDARFYSERICELPFLASTFDLLDADITSRQYCDIYCIGAVRWRNVAHESDQRFENSKLVNTERTLLDNAIKRKMPPHVKTRPLAKLHINSLPPLEAELDFERLAKLVETILAPPRFHRNEFEACDLILEELSKTIVFERAQRFLQTTNSHRFPSPCSQTIVASPLSSTAEQFLGLLVLAVRRTRTQITVLRLARDSTTEDRGATSGSYQIFETLADHYYHSLDCSAHISNGSLLGRFDPSPI